MNYRICTVSTCKRKHVARGFCSYHYGAIFLKTTIGKAMVDKKKHGKSNRYNVVKGRAKASDIPFALTREEHSALLDLPCFYCAGPLNKTGGAVDRVDPRRGYSADNVVPCCTECNQAKNNLTQTEFYRLIERIYWTWRKKNPVL